MTEEVEEVEAVARAICENDQFGPSCVMAEHPEREPCSDDNCNRFAQARAAIKTLDEYRASEVNHD